MRPGKISIYLMYATICFIWGSTWLAIKLGLDGVPPLVGAGFRFAVAGLLFLVLIVSQKLSLRLNGASLRLIAMVGVMNFGLSYGCVYWSELTISSGLASVLFCVFPFFVALLAHYWFDLESLSLKKILGIGFGFAGIVVIYADEIQSSMGSLRGMLAMFVATLASSISLVYLKKYGSELNTLVLNFYSMVLGAVLLLLTSRLLEQGQAIRWSGKNISALLYLAVFGSVVAFTMYFYLLKHLKATQMSFVTFIYPILALLLGSWFLHERLSRNLAVGAAMVLGGIFISNRASPAGAVERVKSGEGDSAGS
ncbi:MAG: EamA family transporter [Acidobacteriia bacterium]|nr:EamA family transporter [Terriglobia bacterium]